MSLEYLQGQVAYNSDPMNGEYEQTVLNPYDSNCERDKYWDFRSGYMDNYRRDIDNKMMDYPM